MITKQQALEFMYNLSNSFSISMDLTKGIDCYLNVYSDSCGTFGVEGNFNSLEEAVTEFIKRFGNTALLEDLKCLIPVDISMLEIGKNYSFKIDQGWKKNYYTDTFKGFKKVTDDIEVLSFEHNDNIVKWEVAEIYKENKCK